MTLTRPFLSIALASVGAGLAAYGAVTPDLAWALVGGLMTFGVIGLEATTKKEEPA